MKDARRFSSYTKKSLLDWARQDAKAQGGSLPSPVLGIMDGMAKSLLGSDKEWVYFDHAYFCRGWEKGNFRAVRNALHLTTLLDRPADRLERFKIKIEPWRKTGREVVVIPPSGSQREVYGCEDWLGTTTSRLDAITDRPVRVKWAKFASLREWMSDCWAVVTYASVAGVEAALMGVPVFSTDRCPSWPVNAGTIEQIETPAYVDLRHELACSLSYATWNVEEMKRVKWADYRYSLCES